MTNIKFYYFTNNIFGPQFATTAYLKTTLILPEVERVELLVWLVCTRRICDLTQLRMSLVLLPVFQAFLQTPTTVSFPLLN
jgi:hypothetical protein